MLEIFVEGSAIIASGHQKHVTSFRVIHWQIAEIPKRSKSLNLLRPMWVKHCHMSIFFLLRDVRQMLLKLVELRSSDWGRVRAAAAASNATPDNDPNYFMVSHTILLCHLFTVCIIVGHYFVLFSSQNEPTFYTEDGTPFTAADPGEPN